MITFVGHTFKLLQRQPGLVEGGFSEVHRLRQAQPDI